MGVAETGRDIARSVDIATRTAAPRIFPLRPMIVKLEGDTDRLRTAGSAQGRRHRTVDSARHGDDDPRGGHWPGKLQVKLHRREIVGCGLCSNPHPALHSRHTGRSEEHTSELQSLMRISYAVLCLKKKKHKN